MLYVPIQDAYSLKEYMLGYGRDCFSFEACYAILEFYEDEDVELDPVSISCKFKEAFPAEILEEYECLDREICIDDQGEWDMKWFIIELEDHTWCRDLGNGKVLYQVF